MDDFGQNISLTSVPEGYKSGYAAIIGKPNAGKSTLLNQILGSRLSIITPKVQTTRHRITGIHSDKRGQIVFLDTPGILEPKYKLHENMMRAVTRSLDDADIILFLLDPNEAPNEDELGWLSQKIKKTSFLIVNKVDICSEERINEAVNILKEKLAFKHTYIISALQGVGVGEMVNTVFEELPEGPPFYPPDQLSEHPERFFASELIREQLFLQYQAEIPYSCAVNIVQYDQKPDIDVIDAEIVVNRKSQKGILIGKGGKALKNLGIESRKSIEEFTGRKVYLNIHVKVREKWRDKPGFLKDYGYD